MNNGACNYLVRMYCMDPQPIFQDIFVMQKRKLQDEQQLLNNLKYKKLQLLWIKVQAIIL